VGTFVTGTRETCGFSTKLRRYGTDCAEWCLFGQRSGYCEYIEGDRPRVSCTGTCDAGPIAVDGRRSPDVIACDVDDFFARMAYNEAASVHAFALLGRELNELGAPRSLLTSIRRAARDEARHARMAARLTRTRVPRLRRQAIARRTPLDIALDNAREGCGRELFGACVGLLLARRAKTAALREYYGAIAQDEVRHAALSFRVHEFLLAKLTPDERAQVERARVEALRASRVSLPAEIADVGDARAIAEALACARG
jgi:hypothetical protein